MYIHDSSKFNSGRGFTKFNKTSAVSETIFGQKWCVGWTLVEPDKFNLHSMATLTGLQSDTKRAKLND